MLSLASIEGTAPPPGRWGYAVGRTVLSRVASGFHPPTLCRSMRPCACTRFGSHSSLPSPPNLSKHYLHSAIKKSPKIQIQTPAPSQLLPPSSSPLHQSDLTPPSSLTPKQAPARVQARRRILGPKTTLIPGRQLTHVQLACLPKPSTARWRPTFTFTPSPASAARHRRRAAVPRSLPPRQPLPPRPRKRGDVWDV